MANVKTLSVTIAEGASLSGEINLNNSTDIVGARLPLDTRIFAIQTPASLTAASVSFDSYDAVHSTWNSVMDGDTELTYTLTAGADIHLDYTIFATLDRIKIRSGTVATPVNQVAALTLGLSLRPV